MRQGASLLRTAALTEENGLLNSLRLAPGMWRIGGLVSLDGRVSWAPRLQGAIQPINGCLLVRGNEAFLIDSGVAAHQDEVLAQLRETLPTGMRLSVFLTRPEPECAGNIGAIHRARSVDEIITVAVNPFDAYEDGVEGEVKVRMLPLAVDKTIPIGEPSTLRVLPTKIRILSTFWLHDSATKTLFSSDWFGHTVMRSSSDSILIDDVDQDETTYESARDFVLQKYWWLPIARTAPMKAFLEETFVQNEIDTIVPTHGRILRGKKVIAKHLDFMQRLLSEVGLDRQDG